VSGKFSFGDGVPESSRKHLMKLHLNLDFQFTSDGTENNYEAQKNNFIARNKNRDRYFRFWEVRNVNSYAEFNMIKITDTEPFAVSTTIFTIATIFLVAEFYKLYVDCRCATQEFTISKLVSAKTNLNIENNFTEHQHMAPSYSIYNRTATFNDPTELIAPKPVDDLPTLDELSSTNAMNDPNNTGYNTFNQNQNVNNNIYIDPNKNPNTPANTQGQVYCEMHHTSYQHENHENSPFVQKY